ncbi:MAG TPA: medium chain dehydrogenase/reductase family protein [candidate division Zixibacteria bacterium]|nr:medium chain dehydrogenase/reductase family protein [candidate division Zixibacteria bacterium]
MKYKSVVITKKGGPEVLKIVENDLREPDANEVRIRIRFAGIGATDVIMRSGYYPFAPKIPFAPGYEIVGIVDAVGDRVADITPGQRVAALTVHGGYAEYIYLPPEELVPVPEGLDSAEALSLILNYVTAYQMMYRVAQVKEGQTIVVTGASGGVGTALLQLGKVAGAKTMYGTASKSKHKLVEELGGIPIDYRIENVARVIKEKEPEGVDAAFDAVGACSARRLYRTLKPGGILVSFGMMSSVHDGKANVASEIWSFLVPAMLRMLPGKRRVESYGITMIYRKDPKPFREDLPKLFQLLAEGRIKPVIADILPLEEAARANEMLEKGEVRGKLVLKCSEA